MILDQQIVWGCYCCCFQQRLFCPSSMWKWLFSHFGALLLKTYTAQTNVLMLMLCLKVCSVGLDHKFW